MPVEKSYAKDHGVFLIGDDVSCHIIPYYNVPLNNIEINDV
jgi:hypothetical protein